MEKQVKTARTTIRYSASFKQKVVSLIESGELSQSGAQKKYDIKGCSTIPSWLKKMGKNHLLSRRVHIETLEEMSENAALKARIKELEQGLIQTQLNYLGAEAYLSVACGQLGQSVEEFKKKPSSELKGTKPAKPQG